MNSWRTAPLPPNWATLRRTRFEHDHWTCVDCGWHDPTGRTLECDHIGRPDDHQLDQLRTRCGPRAHNCHGRKTAREAGRNKPRQTRPPEPHPGLT